MDKEKVFKRIEAFLSELEKEFNNQPQITPKEQLQINKDNAEFAKKIGGQLDVKFED